MPSVAQASGRTAVQKGCLRSLSVGRVREIVSWELAQKYFIDPTFGGALRLGARNVFTSTADFTGIAFLTDSVFVASHRLSLGFASNRSCARKQRGPSITTSRADTLTP